MKRNNPDAAPRNTLPVLMLRNILYVPHYRNKYIYVSPGYPRMNRNCYSQEELVGAGAKYVDMMLWSRGEHGIVNAANP